MHYAVDSQHGTKPLNEWIELFNDSSAAVNVGGWRIEDAVSSDVIPSGVSLAPGKFLVIAATSTTKALWNVPADAQFISLGSLIGDGLSNAGDRILLRNSSGAIVDSVSWGTNTTVLNPAASTVGYGESLTRVPLSKDTNTAVDWTTRPPSPGR